MRIFLALFTVVSLLVVGPLARADEAADKAQVRELEQRCARALVSGDFQALGSIFAEEWVVIGPDGGKLTRQEVFALLKNGDLKFTSYEMGELEIHVFGDTAVVIGHGNPHGESRGEKFEENEVFTDTFIRVGGQWRCVLSHSSEVGG